MRRVTLLGVIVGLMVALVAGCGGQSGGSSGGTSVKSGKAYSPNIRPADFVDVIDNKFFPLEPGTTFIYEGGSERDVMAVTSDTKEIMGVKCVVVDDRGYDGGKLIEKTYDWFAQDNKGNVWYFGEDTKELDNGKVTSTHGSWEAGVDGAKPGIIMQGDPKIGESYRQEYYKGEAEDTAEVVSLDESATVPYGSFDRVLETREWTPLEPSYDEHKYYAAGVGQVSGGGLELVEVNHG
jgi:hypothetical protein